MSGIAINPARVEAVNIEIQGLKKNRGKKPTSEIKWEKVNPHDLALYEDAVAYFFSLLEANLAHFHVVICDFQEYDHRILNKGDRSASVSKTYYQLLLHRCCRRYGGKADIHVRPDSGDCTAVLPSFQNALNADARRRFGLTVNPIRSINLVHSSAVDLMQINDIIVGSIASHRNARHILPGASPAKTRLADLIRARFGVTSYAWNTPYSARRFTIWNWKARQRSALSPRPAKF